ncbi:stage II sporulation protein M [Gloeobacter kilaueensis]|uniref:Stage II sporulation protein M n=1 Tax=Gloeobacter kilaueensis (strain ATCC BAA-2537 / CCAP 1431/1 / ULC 316 / JS1) TaxID=1183438 RepID=U5QKD2_GLOK1|nr:stage II sporulation protein M [Gloeobacter kilaueensis]AGY59432.1 hypothetical protein GKIL_3186 [Gloeobacter kilaueensis JS1]
MNLQRWVGRREADWQKFDRLLSRAESKGLRSLESEQVRELSSLYRSACADLARLRSSQSSERLTADLQNLVARGYRQIYQGLRRQEWRALVAFYRWELPAVIQRSRLEIGLATALLLVGGLIAWWCSWADPHFIDLVMPAQIVHQVRDNHQLWIGSIVGIAPFAGSSIMINNLTVSFAAVAGGITAGLSTAWIVFSNGINLGAAAALVAQNDLWYPFWAFVFPHGALELPAIFLAGGAGLLLARALLFPGRLTRVAALKLWGGEAAKLVYGIVPLLLIAGTIEGFFSPNPTIPEPFKYMAGSILFILLVLYGSRRKAGESRSGS